ncbi:MAG: PEPxxWA-CTERM sorting domain-containing protein [Caulobacteraceae bacterium]|nr:PEPxxWA-CTERM sorting domain-containing protein [Caulobacteraceae bacterium]
MFGNTTNVTQLNPKVQNFFYVSYGIPDITLTNFEQLDITVSFSQPIPKFLECCYVGVNGVNYNYGSGSSYQAWEYGGQTVLFNAAGNITGFTAVINPSTPQPDVGGTYMNYIASVPEPATWALIIAGFSVVGAASRYRRPRVRAS